MTEALSYAFFCMTSFLIIHNCLFFFNKMLNWNDVWSVTNLTDVFLVLTEQDSEKVALKMTLLGFIVLYSI